MSSSEEDASDDDGATGNEIMDQDQEGQDVEEASKADVGMERASNAVDLINEADV
jgi:hypothetical protein